MSQVCGEKTGKSVLLRRNFHPLASAKKIIKQIFMENELTGIFLGGYMIGTNSRRLKTCISSYEELIETG